MTRNWLHLIFKNIQMSFCFAFKKFSLLLPHFSALLGSLFVFLDRYAIDLEVALPEAKLELAPLHLYLPLTSFFSHEIRVPL